MISAGVTLGLLADERRQGRVELRTERIALTEMLADLEADSLELRQMSRAALRRGPASVWMLTAPSTGVPTDTIEARVRAAMFAPLFQQVNSAYLGLKDSGQLGLIRTSDLRRQIVHYYEVDQPYMREFHVVWTETLADFRSHVANYFAM